MNYIIKGDSGSLSKLRDCFAEACKSRGLSVGKVKLLIILLDFIDRGRKAGLIAEVKE